MGSRWRELGSLAICLLVGWSALGALPRFPVLSVVDLGFASLAHLAGESLDLVLPTPLLPPVAGLVVPVAVPLLLGGHFLRTPGEHAAGALSLAWAGTGLTALAVGVQDAALPGPGGPGIPADWAEVLGPPGLGALERAADVAGVLRGGAAVLFAAAAVACVAPWLVAAVRAASTPAAAPEPAAAESRWDGPNRRRV